MRTCWIQCWNLVLPRSIKPDLRKKLIKSIGWIYSTMGGWNYSSPSNRHWTNWNTFQAWPSYKTTHGGSAIKQYMPRISSLEGKDGYPPKEEWKNLQDLYWMQWSRVSTIRNFAKCLASWRNCIQKSQLTQTTNPLCESNYFNCMPLKIVVYLWLT